METDPPPLHLLVPLHFGNLLHGETHGIEIFANVKLASRWTLSPGYTFLTMHLHREAARQDLRTGLETRRRHPQPASSIALEVNLPWHWQWTTSAYFVGRLAGSQIPSYTRLDTNLAWQPSDKNIAGPGGAELTQKSSPGIRRP